MTVTFNKQVVNGQQRLVPVGVHVHSSLKRGIAVSEKPLLFGRSVKIIINDEEHYVNRGSLAKYMCQSEKLLNGAQKASKLDHVLYLIKGFLPKGGRSKAADLGRCVTLITEKTSKTLEKLPEISFVAQTRGKEEFVVPTRNDSQEIEGVLAQGFSISRTPSKMGRSVEIKLGEETYYANIDSLAKYMAKADEFYNGKHARNILEHAQLLKFPVKPKDGLTVSEHLGKTITLLTKKTIRQEQAPAPVVDEVAAAVVVEADDEPVRVIEPIEPSRDSVVARAVLAANPRIPQGGYFYDLSQLPGFLMNRASQALGLDSDEE